MLTLAILGFLAEESLHAYELRRRLSELMGHNRPVSDGALYPALNRLREAGLLSRHAEPGGGAPQRQMLELTEAGRAELLRRLAEPKQSEITNGGEFFVLLAFLGQLPEPAARATVLRRRLAFLTAPAGFFSANGKPQRIKDTEDPYRRGMLVVARAAQLAERAWLEEMLESLPAA
ncbi:PadR family transcriptional regulator [Kitasatospora viridis]|uniref:PadR family transcriptional regulator n=1 Tax=Kitasatospora viridis TaxID=281105 RepID=UPI0011A4FCC2|nr:PadR family transcriptional regulator [Kitasatospora viridis]